MSVQAPELVKIVARAMDPDVWTKTPECPMERASFLHRLDSSLERATAALTALEEAGYAVVPVEPTEAMIQSTPRSMSEGTTREAWKAMLSASLSGKQGE